MCGQKNIDWWSSQAARRKSFATSTALAPSEAFRCRHFFRRTIWQIPTCWTPWFTREEAKENKSLATFWGFTAFESTSLPPMHRITMSGFRKPSRVWKAGREKSARVPPLFAKYLGDSRPLSESLRDLWTPPSRSPAALRK